MTYGITGNTRKEKLWAPVASLAGWLRQQGHPFCLDAPVAEGLAARHLLPAAECERLAVKDLALNSDIVLSFGGDGTLLNTAHQIGEAEVPILGVNIGRLGFLAAVEVADVSKAITDIEEGRYVLDRRCVLDTSIEGHSAGRRWALNDVVVAKSASASMIEVRASVSGTFLNNYWADGVIITTPTGSTAYSLAAGGPLLVPNSGVIAITPIAPHTLTTRPIVLPQDSELALEVASGGQPFMVACDGRSEVIEGDAVQVRVRRARHAVVLIRLAGTDFFNTIRTKLSWGRR